MAEWSRSKQFEGGSRPSVAQLSQNFGGRVEHGYATGTKTTSKPHTSSMGSSWKSSTTSTCGRITVTSRQSSRPSTGPVKVPHTRRPLSEQSMSTDSDDGTTVLNFEGGGRARMHDVEDHVLISMPSSETDTHGEKVKTESSIGPITPELTNPEKTLGPESGDMEPTTSGGGEGRSGVETMKLHESLKRRGSSPYSSGDLRSGLGIVEQAQSSDSMGHDKVVTGGVESSIGLSDYRQKLSRSTSSSSSFEAVYTGRQRGDSTDLKKLHDEEVTQLTTKLSEAEEEVQKIKKEKEKLERKLKETEEVASQAEDAALEMSRLEAELKKEKEEKEILFRIKSASPDISSNHSSLVLSQELEIVKSKLEWEMEANVALEQKLNSLKQSLVVSGKGEGAQRSAAMADLQDKVRHLEQTLEHKEDEMKRQIQVQTRTIASLQAKLSEERQQRQELLQSAPTTSTSRTTTTESASADTTAMTKTLKEKEKEIQQLTQQLQQFEKTASNVAKITLHSKQQSSTIATLKQELQSSAAEKQIALKSSHEEMERMKTRYDNTIRRKDADLEQQKQQVEQLQHEVDGLKKKVTELSSAVHDGAASRAEVESSLDKTLKERNHWQQKSVQQDMVLQTTRQDNDRLHREVNSLNSTVAAQGKEVERLQRENQSLQGEIETHRLTAVTYKEDFESERKDREAVHTKIADMEDRYRHQLQAMGEELRKKADELQRHKGTLANTEQLLRQQQQQMSAQLLQKEEELHAAYNQTHQLQEDVMSKTQQVKQYKKQIDQLNSELSVYKDQAAAHKTQIEFYAKKTEEFGRARTLKELQERKIVELEGQCDQLRAENNELRQRMQQTSGAAGGGGGGAGLRPPIMKAQTMGSSPKRQPDKHMQPLPNPAVQSRFGMGRSFDEDQLHHRAGDPSTNMHSNPKSAPPPNVPYQGKAPFSFAYQTPVIRNQSAFHQGSAVGVGGYQPEYHGHVPRQGMSAHPNNHPGHAPQLQRQDSPHSSLPSSGLGTFSPQHRPPRPVYAQDDSTLYPSPDVVDKDSPPSSTVGQISHPQHAQQRKAHSHMMGMASDAQRLGPSHGRPPQYGTHQPPPHSPHYHNLQILSNPPPNSSSQQRMQRNSVGALGQPNTQSSRPPPIQSAASFPRYNQPQPSLSTPVEETRGYLDRKPPLEGYVKPRQASSHQGSVSHLAVQTLPGVGRSHPTPSRSESARNAPKQGSVSPSPSTGDLSKGIDSVIEHTASKMKEAEQAVEGEEEGEGIPYDPNLVCPKCRMRFREGEIQKFRRHVSSAHK